MNKLSKDKRNKLILVIFATVVVLAGMWFLLIKSIEDRLDQLSSQRQAAQQKLEQVKKSIATADLVEQQLATHSEQLQDLEQGMAAGDLYSWAINSIRQFKNPYRVDIPQFSQIDGPKDTSAMAKFPYQQATLTIAGTALFSDFGRFVADFENAFPYIRVQGLTLEPAPADSENSDGKLQFRMDLVALVRPTTS